MPEYLSPGVYIQEVDSGPRPIEGVGTATAAFVGFAANGPVNRPTLVTNWTQYAETFGAIEDGGGATPTWRGPTCPTRCTASSSTAGGAATSPG